MVSAVIGMNLGSHKNAEKLKRPVLGWNRKEDIIGSYENPTVSLGGLERGIRAYYGNSVHRVLFRYLTQLGGGSIGKGKGASECSRYRKYT